MLHHYDYYDIYYYYYYYWRASVASETLTRVTTQLKIGDVCLFIYNMFGRTYVILYFDLLVSLC